MTRCGDHKSLIHQDSRLPHIWNVHIIGSAFYSQEIVLTTNDVVDEFWYFFLISHLNRIPDHDTKCKKKCVKSIFQICMADDPPRRHKTFRLSAAYPIENWLQVSPVPVFVVGRRVKIRQIPLG